MFFRQKVIAQAWLSPKHTGAITLAYHHQSKESLAIDGVHYSQFGSIQLQALYINVDYSLTDKLAVRADGE